LVYREGTSEVQAIACFPRVVVSADGRGVVSHVGARLLADVAQATGLVEAFDHAVGGQRLRRSAHRPGRVLVDVAVMIADGGEAIADLAVLRNQLGLFGQVASPATCWRVLDSVDASALTELKQARATARERAWVLRGEAGRNLPAVVCAGRVQPGLVIDIDATLVTCHSEKEGTAATYKSGFGYHPMLAWLDNTGEALAGLLRPGNATANDAVDHATVVDEALAQIPDGDRYGSPILVRADSAGGTRGFLGYLRSLRDGRGLDMSFSVGFRVTNAVAEAIRRLPEAAWTVAVDTDGTPRSADETGLPVAQVAELTGLLADPVDSGWPAGMRVVVRSERPHPGAQISVFEAHDGWRYQALATDTTTGQLAWLEARHRAHARVEDKIRTLKQVGIGRFPSREFQINQTWLQLALAAADLIAWTQTILLTGELAKAEPKTLRYRLLHVAARLVHGQRRTKIRIDHRWPWARQLADAFNRLATICPPLVT
jgi:Transposase DDE domain group 1